MAKDDSREKRVDRLAVRKSSKGEYQDKEWGWLILEGGKMTG